MVGSGEVIGNKAATDDVAAGWQAVYDPSSGCTSYQHVDTGETAWTLPEVVPGLVGTTRQTIVFGDEKRGVISNGAIATVHATGKLLKSGKQFWCTKDKDKPFSFTAGKNLNHIEGWTCGINGMKVGEIRV